MRAYLIWTEKYTKPLKDAVSQFDPDAKLTFIYKNPHHVKDLPDLDVYILYTTLIPTQVAEIKSI